MSNKSPAPSVASHYRQASLVSFVAFGAYLLIACLKNYLSLPNEDAFILFKYVENLAHGFGIVFYPGGPRTEGATDFLWLILLSVLRFLKVDVALAAGFLNALGAALATYLFARAAASSELPPGWRLFFYGLALSIPFVGGAVAGYEGFSSMLYSALILLLFRLSLQDRQLHWIPVVSIVVTLFRPDGAIVGISFSLICLVYAYQAGRLRSYLHSALLAVTIGIAYFTWRYLYFGYLLPLPLYVKSVGAVIRYYDVWPGLSVPYYQGLKTNLSWMRDTFGPLTLIVAGVLLNLLFRNRDAGLKRCLVMSVPLLLLLIGFSFSHQAQNIALRFQAPVFLVIFFIVYLNALRLFELNSSEIRRALGAVILAVALSVPLANGIFLVVRSLVAQSFVASFSDVISRTHPGELTLALTEAGRFAFWWHGPTFDLGGLNNAATAFTPASSDYLRRLAPDVIMFNPIALAQTSGKDPLSLPATEVASADLLGLLSERVRFIAEQEPLAYGPLMPVPYYAAGAAARFLVDSGSGYRMFVVQGFDSDEVLVYGFRQAIAESLIDAMQSTRASGHRSYAQIRRLPGAEQPLVQSLGRFFIRLNSVVAGYSRVR